MSKFFTGLDAHDFMLAVYKNISRRPCAEEVIFTDSITEEKDYADGPGTSTDWYDTEKALVVTDESSKERFIIAYLKGARRYNFTTYRLCVSRRERNATERFETGDRTMELRSGFGSACEKEKVAGSLKEYLTHYLEGDPDDIHTQIRHIVKENYTKNLYVVRRDMCNRFDCIELKGKNLRPTSCRILKDNFGTGRMKTPPCMYTDFASVKIEGPFLADVIKPFADAILANLPRITAEKEDYGWWSYVLLS